MQIRKRSAWEIRGLKATPEAVYASRREVLKALGFSGAALFGAPALSSVCGAAETPGGAAADRPPGADLYPVKRSPRYTLDRKLTAERFATSYNNFYEFSFNKSAPARLAQRMVLRPWEVEVTGLVRKPLRLDVDELVRKLPLEERLYRFRCVEAWAMAVPWTGAPLKSLLELAQPLATAKFVRFETFHRPAWGAGFADKEYPWPYHEALTIEEALNELTLVATGMYAKPLPKQNGAPIRLVVPWKYGFKSIKSIVRIELVEDRPRTFWNTVIPEEYDLVANVDPAVPHPRWSQAQENILETGEAVPTQPYNGYGALVAHLYKKR